MGSLLTAQCRCGYSILCAAGADAQGDGDAWSCFFPALCRQCCAVVTVDMNAPSPRCPECRNTDVVPYTNRWLRGKQTAESEVLMALADRIGRRLVLNFGVYYCPNCGKMDLRFA